MKKAIFVFMVILLSTNGFAQNDPAKTKIFPNLNNKLSLNFLQPTEANHGFLSLSAKPKWDAKQFNDEYCQLLAFNKKKELYPLLLIDNRFVNQAMPTRYSSQNYIWVSTQPQYKSFGESIASDIISGFINSKTKKHGLNFKPAQKGYYTAAGIKY
jgi:hypothetical protein